MENVEKIVAYDQYCYKCQYFKTKEYLDPCHECLNTPSNTDSRKPINFKLKEKKEKIIGGLYL